MTHLSQPGNSQYDRIVQALGREIIDGVLPAGTLLMAATVVERFGVSRTVTREGIRVLESMGLVEARPQVGTRVRPASAWNVLHPMVVAWRAEGAQYGQQMRELLEVRLGIDSVAAALACDRMSTERRHELSGLVQDMQAAYKERDTSRYFAADARLHGSIAQAAHNPLLEQLTETIQVVLQVRSRNPRRGFGSGTPASLEAHADLARAIGTSDHSAAQAAARLIVQLTLVELVD